VEEAEFVKKIPCIEFMRLAIVTTHPIQYYAPLLRMLGAEPELDLKVFYTWSQTQQGAKYDRDFDKMIEWDIPLLEGYTYEFVNNTAKDPGVHHFNGIVNPDLNRKISEWNADCLLMIGWNFRSHLSCMRYFKGRMPVLFKGDSTLLDEQPGMKRLLRTIFLTWVYSKVDYALYVGKNSLDYFRKHGLKENQLVFVPHAVDNDRFNGPGNFESEARQWRRELGISDDDLVVLFAGKLEPKKDPDFMLRLAAKLPDPKLKMVIVGNGKLEEELKMKAPGDKRIIFLPFQNQQKMPLVYRLGDIFVLPSRGPGETWGLAVNEAMACKRPVIVSSKCGCTPDLVEEGITGWVFEPGEKGDERISNTLQKILENRSILEPMKEKSWQKVQDYSYPIVVERINDLLKNIRLSTNKKAS
jgi:glycosyltransferase involved in cell wall biosynthesis